MAEPKPFKINISDDLLDFITQRVETARIPPGLELPPDEAWSYGVPPPVISSIQKHWATKYNWRDVESRINDRYHQFTLPIEESGELLNIHFVHHRSSVPGAVPLLFQHGWPGNFLEAEKILEPLTSPTNGQQAYHVVAPSLPGFAFSDGPRGPGFSSRQIAAVDNKLMAALGYERYVAQGGDWGSIIVRIIALDYPENCVAAHVNMLVATPPSFLRAPLTAAYFWGWAPFQGAGTKLGRMRWWNTEENGYFEIQGSKPMTLSYGLVDSPVGMMAWIRDKLQPLIDERDFSWSEEEIITWAMLYIIPGTSGHANIYKNYKGKRLPLFKEYFLNRVITDQVDFGVSVFPYDCYNIPKWWADASVASNIVFWKEHERGGHFAATEKPAELVADIREFTSLFKAGKLAELRESGKLKK